MRLGWMVCALLVLQPAVGWAEWQVKPFVGITFGGTNTILDFDAVAGDTIVDLPTFSVQLPVNGSALCATAIAAPSATSVAPASNSLVITSLLSGAISSTQPAAMNSALG